jgi:predicted MFS family arabinose efflux permease
VLIVCDLSRAIVFVTIAAIEIPTAGILLLAFLAGCFDPPFEASRSALIPQLVGTTLYGYALALSAYVSNLGLLTGYVLGGGLSGWLGPRGALLVNAATFVLSSFLVSRLPNEPGNPSRRPDVRAALRFVARDRVVLASVVIYGLVAFLGMSMEGIAAPYGVDELRFGDAAIGILLAMVPAGTIVATLALKVDGSDRRLLTLAGLAAIAAGGLTLPVFGFELGGVWPYVGFFGVGVSFAASIPTNTAAGRRIPDDIRASTFGILQGVVVGAHALGAAAGGLLANLTSLDFATTSAAAALLGLGLLILMTAPWLVGGDDWASREN